MFDFVESRGKCDDASGEVRQLPLDDHRESIPGMLGRHYEARGAIQISMESSDEINRSHGQNARRGAGVSPRPRPRIGYRGGGKQTKHPPHCEKLVLTPQAT